MFKTKTVLSQMQSFISGYEFEKYVSENNGDKGVRVFSMRNLLNVMLYVHIGAKQSLRDIIDSLKSKKNLWYHLGIISLSRNNLSHALMKRSHIIFEKMFLNLLGKLQNERMPISDKRFKFKMPLKIIDSTTIGLCLSLFDWAKFRKTKGGIKLHVMYDSKEQIPDFMILSDAKKHDMHFANKIFINPNSIYVMDKGYFCYKFFQKVNKNRAFFVIRAKTNTQYKITKRNKKMHASIKADWNVKVDSPKSDEYPDELRVVKYYDKEKKKTYEYLTNNFQLSAKTIADIYKARWDIELFFKWIKQNLKIKTFIGTSENAVKIQIWTAMIAYLLIEYIRFKSKTKYSLLKTFRILKDNIMHNYDLFELLTERLIPDVKQVQIKEKQLLLNF
ncbi:MAG: IS4 family transposase [Thermotogota bacterium]|nr:IS4 family transposase [Thermotogota bacterium]